MYLATFYEISQSHCLNVIALHHMMNIHCFKAPKHFFDIKCKDNCKNQKIPSHLLYQGITSNEVKSKYLELISRH